MLNTTPVPMEPTIRVPWRRAAGEIRVNPPSDAALLTNYATFFLSAGEECHARPGAASRASWRKGH